MTTDGIEQAYCFVHQKRRVYEHSTMEWQKDDIEYAIGQYADGMEPDLLAAIAQGKADFLNDHRSFASDLMLAEERLEKLMG